MLAVWVEVSPEFGELDATDTRLSAAGHDPHDLARIDMIVELTMLEARWAIDFERRADCRDAIINTEPRDLVGAIWREQIGDVIPHFAVEIIAIDVLAIAHSIFVGHRLHMLA